MDVPINPENVLLALLFPNESTGAVLLESMIVPLPLRALTLAASPFRSNVPLATRLFVASPA